MEYRLADLRSPRSKADLCVKRSERLLGAQSHRCCKVTKVSYEEPEQRPSFDGGVITTLQAFLDSDGTNNNNNNNNNNDDDDNNAAIN